MEEATGTLQDPHPVSLDELVPSDNELRALASLGAGPLPVMEIAERLEMTRQGTYKLLGRLRRDGYIARERAEAEDLYHLEATPVVFEQEAVERPGIARLFLCLRVEPYRP